MSRAARFVLSGSLLRRDAKGRLTVRRDAFLPRGTPLETSVIMHDDLNSDLPWTIGRKMAASCRPDQSGVGRRLHAIADVSDSDIAFARLQLMPQPSKISKRHANIVGWSLERVKQQDAALTLAEAAVVHITPQGN